ncbi:MAG: DUF3822 family protein [Chitinophagaceae bacterium]|nr:DUF3822 family protein [Chitinophagaceae bacterium]
MQQVNPSFNIQAPGIHFETSQLFAEAGPMGVSLAILDNSNCFVAVVSYAFSANLNQQELSDALKELFTREHLLQQRYNKTHVFWAFPDSILVPAELMNADRNLNMLNLVFGDVNQGLIRSDFLYKHNLHNVYRLPQPVIELFSTYLPVATQTHLFSTIVNTSFPEGNLLKAIFYSNSITLMLSRESRLQVIQNFLYTEADDCVFHLLNVCKGFDVHPDSVTLQINGMIDAASGLYAAIYKYFLHIEFDTVPEEYSYIEDIKKLPDHFFSHLFELPACV